MSNSKRVVAAENFCGTLEANVDNTKLTDKEFRQFVRNSLGIVVYDSPSDKDDKEQG